MSRTIRLLRNFAVGLPTRAKWKNGDMFWKYGTIIITKEIATIYEVRLHVFSEPLIVVESCGSTCGNRYLAMIRAPSVTLLF